VFCYFPSNYMWSSAFTLALMAACTSASECRTNSRATLLGDGQVLVAGGLTGLNSNPGSTSSAILYNPATKAWTTTGSMNTARGDRHLAF
jgi:Kelch motif